MLPSLRKRQRVGSNTNLPTFSTTPNGTLTETQQPLSFNDPSTADVFLSLHLESSPLFDSIPEPVLKSKPDSVPESAAVEPVSSSPDFANKNGSRVELRLHSDMLRRSRYFSALLSDRWQRGGGGGEELSSPRVFHLNLCVSSLMESVETHVKVLSLLYTNDFTASINSVSSALEILPVALELLFEECVRACVSFLEAVPWTEEEEIRVLNILPYLRDEEAEELLVRLSPASSDSSEEMLHGLIIAAIHNHHNVAFPKAFVAKLLRDLSERDAARRVLDRAFEASLKMLKESLEEYMSPDVRGDHNETEAIQRLNLHKALTNGRHLLWLVERMIELKVADNAVKEWSDQVSFTADLQRVFRDDTWRNIVPGLPPVVLRCTYRLANAVVTGLTIASREIRMKLVKVWLPVLIVCRDKIIPILPSHKSLHQELEEIFLNIISTLPMSESQELLQQCLCFSTRNFEDCPHLTSAFNTWFRRAKRPPQVDNLN